MSVVAVLKLSLVRTRTPPSVLISSQFIVENAAAARKQVTANNFILIEWKLL